MSRGKHIIPLAMLAWVLGAAGAQAQEAPGSVPGADPTFDKWCAHCHRSGLYMAGTLGLQVKYKGTSVPALLEQRTDLTPEIVKTFVRHGSNSMPPFRKTEISDAELDALAKYLSKSK